MGTCFGTTDNSSSGTSQTGGGGGGVLLNQKRKNNLMFSFNASRKDEAYYTYKDQTNDLLDKWRYSDILFLRRAFTKAASNTHSPGRLLLDENAFVGIFSGGEVQSNNETTAQIPKEVARSAFRMFDTDGDGVVDCREFCVGVTLCSHHVSAKEKIQRMFDIFDVDNDGKLSKSEVRALLETSVSSLSQVDLAVSRPRTSSKDDKNVVPDVPKQSWIRTQETVLLKGKDFITFDTFSAWAKDHLEACAAPFAIIPTKEYERRRAKELLQKSRKMRKGQTWYVVSFEWWNHWVSYVGFYENSKKEEEEENTKTKSRRRATKVFGERPGPIDNSSIAGKVMGSLRMGIAENHSFVLWPESLWRQMWQWYGGAPIFPRTAILDMTYEGVMNPKQHDLAGAVELYPLSLTLSMMNQKTALSDKRTEILVRRSGRSTFEEILSCGLENNGEKNKKKEEEEEKTEDLKLRLWYRQDSQSKWLRVPSKSMQKTLESGFDDDSNITIQDGGYFMIEEVSVDNSWPSDLRAEREKKFRKNLNYDRRLDAKDRDGKWYSATVVRTTQVKRWEWLGRIWKPNVGDACVVMREKKWCKGICTKVDRKRGIQVMLKDNEDEDDDGERYKIGDADRIRPLKPDNCKGYVDVVRVTFDGWSSKYDEDFDVNSENLAMLHTYTVDSNDLSSRSSSSTSSSSSSSSLTESNKRSFFSRLIFGGESSNNNNNNFQHSFNEGSVGLCNLGNTCYMNATLQCLAHTLMFRDFLISGRWKCEINRSNKRGTRGKLTKELAKVFRKLCLSENDQYIRPSDLKSIIGDIFPQFRGYEQQDAQELLCCLLDKIHEDVNHVSPLAEKKKKERLQKEKEEQEKEKDMDDDIPSGRDGAESKSSESRIVLTEREMFESDERAVCFFFCF